MRPREPAGRVHGGTAAQLGPPDRLSNTPAMGLTWAKVLTCGIRSHSCGTIGNMTRLQRFRAYMARMNPVADPATAIREGLYVAPPGRTVADELATRLELEPASTHLVLGGIGSGKTTELLRAADRLKASSRQTGDLLEYVDISQKHDLDAPTLSGVLVALVGLSFAEHIIRYGTPDAKSREAVAINLFRRHANGYDVSMSKDRERTGEHDNEAPTDHMVHVRGALVRPENPLPYRLHGLVIPLRILRAVYPGDGKHVIFLFDSLDRLPSPERFHEAVRDDLRVLKAAGIGVVVIGPIRFMVGTDRSINDLFDHTHFRLATDPTQVTGRTFLTTVLRLRAESDFLPDECLDLVARASGGVMRDLIALAKRAGEEAYAVGHDSITVEDTDRAIDAFGRSLAIGLDDLQVKKLRHIREGAGFVVRGEAELSLLETRRVLLYDQSRWIVHPALAPLLDAMTEAA